MALLNLPTTPAERFAALLAGLRRAVAAEAARNRPLQILLCLIHARLGHIAVRFARLAARIPANAAPRPHPGASARTTPARAAQPVPPCSPPPRTRAAPLARRPASAGRP